MSDLFWPLQELRLARLVSRAQRGDRQAFRGLYRMLYLPVWRFVRRRTRSQGEAEELVGQVFFQLLEKLPRLDGSRNVRGYVLAIARNALVDAARRETGQVPETEATQLPSPEASALAQLISAEDAERIRGQLAALPNQTREWLTLRFEDGLRFAEIAELAGVNEAAVRQRVSRAVRELRQQWREAQPQGGVAHEP